MVILFIFGCIGSSLLSASGFGVWGLLSLVAAHDLLIEVASLASVAVAHGLSFPVACGILLDRALNLCTPHWPGNSRGVVVKNLPGMQEHIRILHSKLLFSGPVFSATFTGQTKSKL